MRKHPLRRKSDRSYPKSAIDGLIQGVHDKINEKAAEQTLHYKEMMQGQERRHQENKKRFDEIKEQTTKTNGRVTSLEKFQYIVMGLGIAIMIVIVPLFLKLF